MVQSLREVLLEPEVMRSLTQDPASFRYSVIVPADRYWGAERPNGSWTGMMGQVIQKEVDIALGPFGITLSRNKVVDFTDSFYFDDRSILSKKGEPEIDPWGFLYPLTESVWAAMAVVLAAVWLVLTVVSRRPRGAALLDWSGELLLENIRVILNQDVKKTLILGTLKTRTVLGSWMVVAAVVYWSYAGTLTSLLAVRHIPQPIQTLRDMLDDSSVTVLMEPDTLVTETISKMKSGELWELHELQFVSRVKYQLYSTFPVALNTLVRHHRHSIIATSLSVDLYVANIFTLTANKLKRAPAICRMSLSKLCPLQQKAPVSWALSLVRAFTISTNTLLGKERFSSLRRLVFSFTRPYQMWQISSVMSMAVKDGTMSLPRSNSSVNDL
ncbi:Glutamate receptor ionotropic, delta-1 [Chionoecetes opilio]|uniref:Glutamate receptor ionotropic, delta-1 n=1 Tax=Chionoecetes opilio TaxID=41210 RepID=A0A8J4YL34_CHIOP|nr:Glutamate receptor ionotropic, delta-1 [Chionoecetes opilio]